MPGPFPYMDPEQEREHLEKLNAANLKLSQALDPERAKVRQHLIDAGVTKPDNAPLWEDESLSPMEKVILGWLQKGNL